MKGYNTIIKVLIGVLVFLAAIIFLSVKSYCQDSIKLRITKVKSTEDRKIYWLKDEATKQRYITQCRCSSDRKKGEFVSIARKDLVIIKESFGKRDLEN